VLGVGGRQRKVLILCSAALLVAGCSRTQAEVERDTRSTLKKDLPAGLWSALLSGTFQCIDTSTGSAQIELKLETPIQPNSLVWPIGWVQRSLENGDVSWDSPDHQRAVEFHLVNGLSSSALAYLDDSGCE
jgi:hypothetical protein